GCSKGSEITDFDPFGIQIQLITLHKLRSSNWPGLFILMPFYTGTNKHRSYLPTRMGSGLTLQFS
ncbi:MAG: hypothetical protein AAFN81_05690, partial [Bacteroidota bacterium]